MNNSRIDQLEIKMSYLEKYLNQLNDIVLENSRILKSIKKEQLSFRHQMDEVTNQLPAPPAEKPPHY
jgi:uncharacterized coiled-coil protein SlyX